MKNLFVFAVLAALSLMTDAGVDCKGVGSSSTPRVTAITSNKVYTPPSTRVTT